MQDFTNSTVYNFKGLLDRFTEMDFEEVIAEYFFVAHKRADFLNSSLPDDVKFMHVEPLDEAYDYLGHYLAQSVCSTFGYDF